MHLICIQGIFLLNGTVFCCSWGETKLERVPFVTLSGRWWQVCKYRGRMHCHSYGCLVVLNLSLIPRENCWMQGSQVWQSVRSCSIFVVLQDIICQLPGSSWRLPYGKACQYVCRLYEFCCCYWYFSQSSWSYTIQKKGKLLGSSEKYQNIYLL